MRTIEEIKDRVLRKDFPSNHRHFGGANLIITDNPKRMGHEGDFVLNSPYAAEFSWLVDELKEYLSDQLTHENKYAFYRQMGELFSLAQSRELGLVDAMTFVLAEVEKFIATNGFPKTIEESEIEVLKRALKRFIDASFMIRGSRDQDNLFALLLLLTAYKDGIIAPEFQAGHIGRADWFQYEFAKSSFVKDKKYAQVVEVFAPYLNMFSVAEHHTFIHGLKDIPIGSLKTHFTRSFDWVLAHITSIRSGFLSDSIHSAEITMLMCGLAETDDSMKVFNPFAGLGGIGYRLKSNKTLCQEIDRATWAVGELRMMAHGLTDKIDFALTDSILNWPEKSEKFDLVIANPPIGIKFKQAYGAAIKDSNSFEHFFVTRGLASLNENGKLIALVPQKFLHTESQVRKYLFDQELVDTVISIPGGVYNYTHTSLMVVVIDKAKRNSGRVKFVDAKSFVDGAQKRSLKLDYNALLQAITATESSHEDIKILDVATIAANDYSFNVGRYMLKKYEGIELSEILQPLQLRAPRKVSGAKFVRASNLKTNKFDFRLDFESLQEEELNMGKLIEESCILLTLAGSALNPTYFEYSGTPIVIGNTIAAYKVDEQRWNLDYLIYELHSDYIKEQIKAIDSGSIYSRLSNPDIRWIKVDISISIEEQARIAKQRLQVYAEEEGKKLEEFRKLNGITSEYYEQSNYLRHTLNGRASNLKSSVIDIRTILEQHVETRIPEIFDMKVSADYQITLKEYLDILQTEAAYISDSIKSQLGVEARLASKELAVMDILDYLRRYIVLYNGRADTNAKIESFFDFELLSDEDSFEDSMDFTFFINGNRDLLTEMLDNIMKNANEHAFTPESINRLELFVSVRIDAYIPKLLITVSNSGRPFPDDFSKEDYIRNGIKKGHNGGSGFGGWLVNKIVAMMSGDFEIERISNEIGDGKLVTSIHFTFPLIQSKYELTEIN
jgi:type I restriction enzyme M protein